MYVMLFDKREREKNVCTEIFRLLNFVIRKKERKRESEREREKKEHIVERETYGGDKTKKKKQTKRGNGLRIMCIFFVKLKYSK